MFDKFENACEQFGWKGQYAKLSDRDRRHHARYVSYVNRHGLLCQECKGAGQLVDDYIDHYAVYVECGFCEGTGKVTRHMRGWWLRWKREEKQCGYKKER